MEISAEAPPILVKFSNKANDSIILPPFFDFQLQIH